MKDVKLSPYEFDVVMQALVSMVRYDTDGMFGDGQDITDKVGLARAKRVLSKLHYS